MSNIRYYNQAPQFWDWVADMETVFGGNSNRRSGPPGTRGSNNEDPTNEQRGTHGPHPPPPPPPPPQYGEAVPPASPGHEGPTPPGPDGPPPVPGPHNSDGHPCCNSHETFPNHRGPPGFGCRGGRGGYGCRGRGRRHGPPFGHFLWGGFGPGSSPQPFDLGSLGQFIEQFTQQSGYKKDGGAGDRSGGGADKDFSPPCDVFDTPEEFIVHVSLAGAKKEDVGVNWDADKSELSVAGVVYRPADEETLKNLALDEREVGVFERKIRLGSRANPASIDADGITAKMSDGVLIIKVPKVEEFVEVKKVDVQ